jgi:urease accessory protein
MAVTMAVDGVVAPPRTEKCPGWQAELDIAFASEKGRTVLVRRRHRGPLVVQRPFYPEGPDACHLYVLHPPGGMVGGDDLAVNVAAKEGATALVTTPAAGKVYRTMGPPVGQRVRLIADSDARLEWLPQETILFDRSALHASTSIDLESGARFIGWDAICFGRVAAGESFAGGTYRQSLEVRVEGELLLVEPSFVAPASRALTAPFAYAGHCMAATLVAYPASEEDESAVVEATSAFGATLAGVTRLSALLVVRLLSTRAPEMREAMVAAWRILRPRVIGREPCAPRIWRT